MRRHFLAIDGHQYFLPPETDVDALSEEIASAARKGGEMVEAATAGGETVRFLSSTGAPIIIETVDVPDDEPAPEDGQPPFTDFIDDL